MESLVRVTELWFRQKVNMAWNTQLVGTIAFCLCVNAITIAEAARCQNGDKIGENNPKDEDKDKDPETGVSILMTHRDYEVDCDCGYIYEWNFYTKDNTGDVYFQVWRSVGGTWTLLGQNSYTVTAADHKTTVTVPVAISDRFPVTNGDQFGLYFPGASVVTYDNGQTYKKTTSVGSLTSGDTYNWDGETNRNGRDYGFNGRITRGTDPSFTNLDASVSISDVTSISTVFYTVTATDSEIEVITMSMTSTSTFFQFDPASGQVSVLAALSSGTYNLNFRVVDQCLNSDTGTLRITVTNSVPIITSLPSYGYVYEYEKTERLLHTIGVTDTSPNDIVTCSLASNIPATGNILVKLIPTTTNYGIFLKNTPTLDYATQKRYKSTITCTDSKDPVSSIFLTFVLENDPPKFTNLQGNISVPSTTGNNIDVFTVGTTDKENDPISFSLTCDRTPCPFSINSVGTITTTSSLIGMSDVGYDLSVTLNDGYTTTKAKTLTIKISDINTAPIIKNLPLVSPMSVPENTAVGTTIFQPITSDIDSGQTLTYTPVFSPASGGSIFKVETNTGIVTTKANINYETIGTLDYDITITVSDGLASDNKVLSLRIEDVNEPPSFSLGSYSLVGNEGPAGTSLGIPYFAVTDPDIGDTQTFSIDCPQFLMDSSTGEVTYSIAYNLDIAGTSPSVTCTMTVDDIFKEKDTALLFIYINEVNDFAPKFEYSIYTFTESIYDPVGSVIGTTTATDGDIGIYGTFSYFLDQSSLDNAYFSINPSGQISSVYDLSSLQGSTLFLSVTCFDIGGKNDTADVVIVIPATTTVPPTTTTERYKVFLEDSSNVGWFSSLVLVLFCLFCVFVYMTLYKDFCSPVKDCCCPKRHRKRTERRIRKHRRVGSKKRKY